MSVSFSASFSPVCLSKTSEFVLFQPNNVTLPLIEARFFLLDEDQREDPHCSSVPRDAYDSSSATKNIDDVILTWKEEARRRQKRKDVSLTLRCALLTSMDHWEIDLDRRLTWFREIHAECLQLIFTSISIVVRVSLFDEQIRCEANKISILD